jgi:hypothetical protein
MRKGRTVLMYKTTAIFAAALLCNSAWAQEDNEDPYQAFYEGPPNSRTWTVDTIDGTNEHFEIGDAFRIVRAGNVIQMIPVGVMAEKNWIGMTTLFRRDDLGFILCTEQAQIRHGGSGAQVRHVLRFELSDDTTELEIELGDDDESCDSLEQHGGTAHALN